MTLVQQKWCLGECALPLTVGNVDLVEFDGVNFQTLQAESDVFILSLTATGNKEWLVKCLGKTNRWWVTEGHCLPLMKEVRKSIPISRKGLGTCVLAIEVQGKKLLVLSNPHKLSLAFEKAEFQTLEWFIEELKKDLRTAAEHPAEEPPTRKRLKQDEGDYQELIEEALQNLQNHSNCERAWFFKSRNSLKVLATSTRLSKTFVLKRFNKKVRAASIMQDAESKQELQDMFLDAATLAIQFLDAEGGGAASSSRPREDPSGDSEHDAEKEEALAP